MAEYTISDKPHEQEEIEPQEQAHENPPKASLDAWVLHMDGSSSPRGSEAGLILSSLEGTVAEYTLHFEFSVINNEVKYEILIVGLRIAKKLWIQDLKAHNDSQLVVGHI